MKDAAIKVTGLSADWPPWERVLYGVLVRGAVPVASFLLLGYFWLPVFFCPPKAVNPEAPRRAEIVSLPTVIHFDVDRALVSLSMRPQLETLARHLAQMPDVGLLLEGHADSDYRSDYNLELSRLRAEAVKSILVGSGLDARRIIGAGYGETRPRNQDRSCSGKAENRRVDLSLFHAGDAVPHPSIKEARQ